MSNLDELEKSFETAKRTPPEPSNDFMARVLSDGLAQQPAAAGVLNATPPKRGSIVDRVTGMFTGLSDAIGGWPGFAGLATAAVTGVWIGISPPQSLSAPLNTVLGTQDSVFSTSSDLGDGFDFTLYEG